MRIRTYLTISYLILVVLVTFGTLVIAQWTVESLEEKNLLSAEAAIKSVTTANLQLSEELLVMGGMRIVEMKAEEVADRLSHALDGRNVYDYEQLRKDEKLRKIATQEISTYLRSSAGYVDVYDRTGLSIWHPNKSVEGRNFAEWQNEFPEMWKYVERSFSEKKVAGYYDFLDASSGKRRKFMVIVQSPGTPFIVAATVNIDEFFKPVHDEIQNESDKAVMLARQSIKRSGRSIENRFRLLSTAGSLLLLGIGALFALWFASSVSRPIMRLRDAVATMGKGNWSVEVPEKGAAEVRHLGKAFNELAKQLTEYIEKRDFIRDTFGRYVTPGVVSRLLESQDGLKLGGESRQITMIMSDIRGFTALMDNRQPQQVVFLLNRYLGKMVEIIQSNGGIVDEIMGDGILAFFGAPEPLPDHPARALASALKMQAAMDEINTFNQNEGLPALEMGIAVHTGEVIVGNIGSEKRTKYGAVGSDVNLVGRMESYAVGGQVLISSSTYEKIPGKVEVANTLEIKMKGVPQPLLLYDVRGISEPYNIRLPEQKEELILLANSVGVRLYILDRKAVPEIWVEAYITHYSPRCVCVSSTDPVSQWEDVKIQIVDEDFAAVDAECYAKVISVKQVESGHQFLMRFTCVPPEVIEALRQAAGPRPVIEGTA